MNIERYYWEATNEDEARAIWGLLYPKMSSFQRTCYTMPALRSRFFCVGDGEVIAAATEPEGRVKTTAEHLLAMALRGFEGPLEGAS